MCIVGFASRPELLWTTLHLLDLPFPAEINCSLDSVSPAPTAVLSKVNPRTHGVRSRESTITARQLP